MTSIPVALSSVLITVFTHLETSYFRSSWKLRNHESLQGHSSPVRLSWLPSAYLSQLLLVRGYVTFVIESSPLVKHCQQCTATSSAMEQPHLQNYSKHQRYENGSHIAVAQRLFKNRGCIGSESHQQRLCLENRCRQQEKSAYIANPLVPSSSLWEKRHHQADR